MAEIHVQTKKQQPNPVWMWIVLAVIIIGAAIYFLTRTNETETEVGNPAPPTSILQFQEPSQYLSYHL